MENLQTQNRQNKYQTIGFMKIYHTRFFLKTYHQPSRGEFVFHLMVPYSNMLGMWGITEGGVQGYIYIYNI